MQPARLSDLKVVASIAGVLVIGILVIGITYSFTSSIYQSVQHNALKSRELVSAFNQFRTQLDGARKYALTFFGSSNPEHYEAYKQMIDEAETSIQDIESTFTLTQDQQALVSRQQEARRNLEKLMAESAKKQLTLGYDNRSGMRGELNQSAANLQETLAVVYDGSKDSAKLSVLQLKVSAYKMRVMEKTFLESHDEKILNALTSELGLFLSLLNAGAINRAQALRLENAVNKYYDNFRLISVEKRKYNETQNIIIADFSAINDLSAELVSTVTEAAKATDEATEARASGLSVLFYTVLGAVLIATTVALLLLSRQLNKVIDNLQQSLRGRANDLKAQQEKNDALSESVLRLMEAAERLSNKDLTVTVPATDDITGSFADALNMVTRSTAVTIWRITKLTKSLEAAATTVNRQNNIVAKVAREEKTVVNNALDTLERSRATMASVTELANNCSVMAHDTAKSTNHALDAVYRATNSMLNIRNTVHETEKSIKRLGERSHEISAIVEIIKDIAERTHTLALNAGMQAVAAGEAGRGFSIVADEVQRLAEMARESTGRITLLVKSIQAESSESMRIMNKAIDQVVVGSDKADIASEAMRSTGEAAGTLLEAINRLTEQSKEQAAYNEGLNNMAGQLRITSEATGAELVAQAEQTEAMLANMQQLVQSVEVFTLPGERKPA